MKAVFLDRDGVINELMYYPEQGIVDSPFTPQQVRLIPKAAIAIRNLNRLGFKVVIVSNQPGVAKKHFTKVVLEKITKRLEVLLSQKGAHLDGIYYCLHHPQAKIAKLRKRCSCRKPKPGLLKKAAKEWNIDLKNSYMIGDGLSDIQAGKTAGCKTILIGSNKCDWCREMEKRKIKPDYIVANLLEAARVIKKLEG